MYTIATLYELQRQLGLPNPDAETAADLRRALQKASHLVETLTQRRYCPYFAERELVVDPARPRELILPDDLLQLKSMRRGDGSELSLDAVRLLPNHPDLPASVLITAAGAPGFGVGPGESLTLTGVWGWHDRWTRAWRDSGETLRDEPLDAAATAISLRDADAPDAQTGAPRFQIGQLLRIGGEYLRVNAIDAVNERITVLRAVQGTEAAAHAQGARIEVYEAAPAIRDLCLRYAALLINTVGLPDEDPAPLLSSLRRLTI